MGNPTPDPIFGATAPVPGEDVSAHKKSGMGSQAMPGSPLFWGRKYVPPSPAEAVAARGPQPYPRMMYNVDGRMQVAENAEMHSEALKNGWLEKPDLVHRELLQVGDNGMSGKRLPTAGSAEVVNVVGQPMKWGTAALVSTTQVTQHHVDFMNEHNYKVKSIKEVEKFVEGLSTEEAAQFFTDAASWTAKAEAE